MKILVIILVGIAGAIALILIIALFSKREYAVQREVIINKPVHEVFNYVKHLKNQDNFSKWVMTDPAMKKTYSGVDGTDGFIYAWDGNKQAGAGEQEIINIVENKRVDIEIRFERPFKGLANAPFTVDALTPDKTKVRWGMSSKMAYPMNAILLFQNMDKMLGDDLQTSLMTLKDILEN